MFYSTILISNRKLEDSLYHCVKLLGTRRVLLEERGSLFVHFLSLREQVRVSLGREILRWVFSPRKHKTVGFEV